MRHLGMALFLVLAVACGAKNSLTIDEPLSEDLPTALKQIQRRVATRSRLVPFAQTASESSESSGRGAVSISNGIQLYLNIDLRPVCGLPVSLDGYVPVNGIRAGGMHTIVLIHGGGWVGGTREAMNPIAARFLDPKNPSPWIVINLSYPLGVPMEQVFGGVACAVAWLKTTSSNGLINPNRISALGGSAGGHLAGLLASLGGRAGAASVHSAVSFVGPADLEKLWTLVPQIRATMLEVVLKGPPVNNPKYAQFSPTTYLSSGDASPSLWLGGTGDPIVPIAAGSQAALQTGNSSVQVKDFAGGHDMPAAEIDYVINNFFPAISPE